MKRFSIVLRGRVQGVGFRFFTYNCARRHNLSGWVRNTPDGGVEIEAQGDENNLEYFKTEIRKGPPLAKVIEIKEVELPLSGNEKSFEIRH